MFYFSDFSCWDRISIDRCKFICINPYFCIFDRSAFMSTQVKVIMICQIDQWMGFYAAFAKEKFPKADANQEVTGAAGGLGFAFLTFTDAVLESGIKIVLEETQLEEYVKDADLVITGEGRMDGQTAMGKAPVGVAALAKKYGKPVLAFAGAVERDARKCNEHGIDAFFPILRGVVTLEEAMKNENAKRNLADTVEQVYRTFTIL